MVLASASMVVFLLAYGVIRYFKPNHAFWLEIGALGGFLLSMLLWLLVAIATPAPMAMKDAALTGASSDSISYRKKFASAFLKTCG